MRFTRTWQVAGGSRVTGAVLVRCSPWSQLSMAALELLGWRSWALTFQEGSHQAESSRSLGADDSEVPEALEEEQIEAVPGSVTKHIAIFCRIPLPMTC